MGYASRESLIRADEDKYSQWLIEFAAIIVIRICEECPAGEFRDMDLGCPVLARLVLKRIQQIQLDSRPKQDENCG